MTAAVFASAAIAAFPGANGRIAYLSRAEGVPGVAMFTVRPRGSGVSRLDAVPSDPGPPSWSASGRKLVFVRTTDATSQLLVMNANGTKLTRVVKHGRGQSDIASPSFSPNGRRIIYTGGSKIRTVRTDGTNDRPILVGSEPQYSPNGRRIVFAGTPRGKRRDGIWTARRDGSRLRRLTTPGKKDPDIFDTSPDYSPDGRRVVFSRYYDRYGSQVRLVRVNDRHERGIRGANDVGAAAFAPNGRRIAVPLYSEFAGYLGPTCSDLYTMSLRGTRRYRLTADCDSNGYGNTVWGVSWRPSTRNGGGQ